LIDPLVVAPKAFAKNYSVYEDVKLILGAPMRRFIPQFIALFVVTSAAAFGQGNFGQLAYGGCWTTTFTLINLNAQTAASVSLFFYADNGSPLSAPVQGVGNTSSYAFNIPPNGAQNVVLSSTDSNYTEGWANMTASSGVTVGGQATFLCHIAGSPDQQAIVPLSSSLSTACIIPFPPPANPVILLPFDNTAGYTTSLAFANTTSTALSVPIEFDDQSNNPLVKDTLNLTALQHEAFASTMNYSALIGKRGILRISTSTTTLSVLGLLFNSSGPFTTILPITLTQ
jgi:hypothetical protein